MKTADEQTLDNLRIGHFVVAGLNGFGGLLALAQAVFGILLLNGTFDFFDDFDAFMGWMYLLSGIGFFLLCLLLAVAFYLSGRFLGQRRNYTFSFVTACIACLQLPVGTVVGILTILHLNKDSVKAIYGRGPTRADGTMPPPIPS